MQKIAVSLTILIAFAGCQKSEKIQKSELSKAEWLIGKWENKSAEGILSENWKKENDSTFNATSNFVKEKDTLHYETIKLFQNGATLTYQATVMGQNNNKAVAFKLTSATEKQLVFENPKHDYPQKISYTKVSNDSLVAEISGIQHGNPSVEKYLMGRK